MLKENVLIVLGRFAFPSVCESFGTRTQITLQILKGVNGPFQSYVAFFGQNTERSHSCTAFPVEFFVSEKMSTIYTLSRLWTFQKNINKINPIPVTAMQRFCIF